MASNTTGKPIKCKAGVLYAVNEQIVVEDVEVDPPKASEVRVKVVASGVCHSDASHMIGIFQPNVGPVIMGHEGAGIVESIGEGVKSVKPGDHVILMWMPYCGECVLCKLDFTNKCQKFLMTTLEMPGLSDGTSRFTCKGKKLHHFMWTSAFSQYTVLPESCVAKINPAAPLEKVCLLGCGIPTGYGASVNIAKVRPGSTCAVWGLGGVGLAAVMGCKAQGAKRIIGIDINSDKFELAKKFGCTEFVNPKDHTKSVPEVLKEMTGGVGVDFAIECCGTIPTMSAAFEATSPIRGTTTLVGISRYDTILQLSPLGFISGKTLTGGAYGEYKGRKDIPALVEKYLKGELMVDEFHTHTLPLERINEAFTLMKEGKSIRTVLTMH